jgi:hypothetical protein
MTHNHAGQQEAVSRLLRETELATRLNIAVRTVRQWRWRGGGPPFIKVGSGVKSAVRYSPAAVERWLANQSRISTSDNGGAAA